MPSSRTPGETRLPPRCPGLPFIGNAHQLLSDPGKLLVDGQRRFGSIFRLRAAGTRLTVVAGETAKAFMAEGVDDAHLSRHAMFGPVEREFGPADFVMAHSGERHTRLRAPLAISFSRQVASPFVPQLTTAVREAARAWPLSGRVAVTEQTRRLSFAQWCRLLGPGASRLAYEDCHRLSSYWMMVGAALVPAWAFRVPWYRSAHKRTFAIFRDLVREARQAGPLAGGPPTIIDTLLSATDSSDTPLTDDEAVTYIAYGTLGACAYVARLTAFMLYEIIRDRELTEVLRDEVRQAFDAGIQEASDLRRIRVLQSVYHETLRRHVISAGMPYIVDHDFEYAGMQFLKGETTLVSPVSLSFSSAGFRNPEQFDPARCREPRNEHRKGNVHPFGLGNRTCVAGGLVEVMAITQVAALLEERQMTMDPPGYELKLTVRPLPAPSRRFGIRAGESHAKTSRGPLVTSEEERLVSFVGHDDPAVVTAIAGAEARRFPPGTVIIREGDPSDSYYFLQAGTAVVTQGAASVRVAELKPGDGFGETGLLQNAPRNATVTAGASGSDTLVIGREAFLAMVASSDLVATEIRGLMQKRTALNRLRHVASDLTVSAAAQVLPDFTWERYGAGDVLIREGDAAEHFFVLVEGQVEVFRLSRDGEAALVAILGPGEYFGEVGLLHRAPRNATVKAAASGPVTVLKTDASGFDRLLNQTGESGAALARTMLAATERLSGR
jgi:CRP-like cAMP-binding protein/cytochrome P450